MNLKVILAKGIRHIVPSKILAKCGRMEKCLHAAARQTIAEALQNGKVNVVKVGLNSSVSHEITADGYVISRGGIASGSASYTTKPARVLTTSDAMLKAGVKPSEQSAYKEILGKYRQYKPEVKEYDYFGTSASRKLKHVDGTTSEFTSEIIEKRGSYGQILEEEKDCCFHISNSRGKELKVDLKTQEITGDEAMQKELSEFLGEEIPNRENLQAFLEYRDFKYLKEKGFPDLNEFEIQAKSVLKGKEIAKQEERYHSQRQRMYEGLWRPYHTGPFYRIVGEEELLKALKGERIVSKNSTARYGYSCVDITTNGNYHEIFYGETKYRITFKSKLADGSYNENFIKDIIEKIPENQHFQAASYSRSDIDKIHFWNGNDWVRLDF